MKKWWIVVLAAAVACVGIGAVTSRPTETVTVKTMHLTPRKVEQTETCTGAVEAADSVGVFVPTACVLREVTVQKGDTVKAGDVLALVDKDATRQLGLVSGQKDSLLLAAMGDTLTAPQDGVVIRVDGQTGGTLETKTPCVMLAPRTSFQVRIAIREKQLRTLKEGMAVKVTGAGFTGKSYDGTLTEISSTARTVAGGNGGGGDRHSAPRAAGRFSAHRADRQGGGGDVLHARGDCGALRGGAGG